jgi:hypothetical protein
MKNIFIFENTQIIFMEIDSLRSHFTLGKDAPTKALIYLLSFAIFLAINNFLCNIVNIIYLDRIVFNFWKGHKPGCGYETPFIYTSAFVGLKLLTFVGLWLYVKKKNVPFVGEIFIAYFLYDFAWILLVCGNKSGIIPYKLPFFQIFSSNPQFVFRGMLEYFTYIFWSIGLGAFLFFQQKLSVLFILKRLAFIPISVLMIQYGIVYFVRINFIYIYDIYIFVSGVAENLGVSF